MRRNRPRRPGVGNSHSQTTAERRQGTGPHEMTRILVLQGANLNWLGLREPEKYGTTTAEELDEMIRRHAEKRGFDVEILYCNGEGQAIDALYAATGAAGRPPGRRRATDA